MRFENPRLDGRKLKVPQVGWNFIRRNRMSQGATSAASDPWENSLFRGLADRESMYFVHSFYVQPADSSLVLSYSEYGGIEFCSALMKQNIFAFQFHPERSGPKGLQIYSNIAASLGNRMIGGKG